MMTEKSTRGERNLNPGNLLYMRDAPWRGQVGLEIVPAGMSYKPRFGRYDDIHNGIRALAKQLLAYQQRDGLRSISAMINRYAPPADHNATDAYVGAVCNYCGVTPNDDYPISDLTRLTNIVFAVIRQENGRVIYPADLIASACRDALGVPIPLITPP